MVCDCLAGMQFGEIHHTGAAASHEKLEMGDLARGFV
jgi:hypothetical protein